jgi:hypothetical protein
MSQSYTARRFPKKYHPISLGLNLRFVSTDEGLGDQAFSASLLKSITHAFERLVTGIHGPLQQGGTKVMV